MRCGNATGRQRPRVAEGARARGGQQGASALIDQVINGRRPGPFVNHHVQLWMGLAVGFGISAGVTVVGGPANRSRDFTRAA